VIAILSGVLIVVLATVSLGMGLAGLLWILWTLAVNGLPALLSLDIPGYEGRNVMLIAFLILVVQTSDVAQYVWGKLLGRTRISPDVSPSKTLEGLIGGALSAILIGVALSWITPFTPWQAGLLSFVIAMLGFLSTVAFAKFLLRVQRQMLLSPLQTYRLHRKPKKGFQCPARYRR
jgi:predicted CDP-diglyceride synthetase/phosphatidate cytidylyltransferase